MLGRPCDGRRRGVGRVADAVDVEQRREHGQQARDGQDGGDRDRQPVTGDDQSHGHHQRQREQPATALGEEGQLKPGAGDGQQHAAQQRRQLPPHGQAHRHQGQHHEQGSGAVQVAHWRDQTPLDHQRGDVIASRQVQQGQRRDHADPDRPAHQHPQRPPGRPPHHRQQREQEQVHERPIAARQGDPLVVGPRDRRVGPQDVGREAAERDLDRRAEPAQRAEPAGQRRRQRPQQHQSAPVPRVFVKASVVGAPDDDQGERDRRRHQWPGIGYQLRYRPPRGCPSVRGAEPSLARARRLRPTCLLLGRHPARSVSAAYEVNR